MKGIKAMKKQMLTTVNTVMLNANENYGFNFTCLNFVYDYAIAGLELDKLEGKERMQRYRCKT